MKSCHDSHGNVIQGVSILEDLLSDERKTSKLMDVLKHFEMRIMPSAELRNKTTDWIVPVSW